MEIQERLNAQRRAMVVRRRALMGTGAALMALGLLSLAVSPETESNIVLLRVVLGFGLLLGGFLLALGPLLVALTQEEDD